MVAMSRRSALEKMPARFEWIFRRHMIIEDVGVRDSAYHSVTTRSGPKCEPAWSADSPQHAHDRDAVHAECVCRTVWRDL
jgi:hypothetical protein